MFDAERFIRETVEKIKKDVKGKALIAFSGGVDSTVCASLVNKAVGKNLVAVHVDTGYMRKNESRDVKKLMDKMGLNFRFIDASKEFYKELKGIEDPEKKRKIIGEKFIRVFEKVAE
ncbi:MAG: argininosuccinate synthase, partial [Thermoplasmatales archaeon]